MIESEIIILLADMILFLVVFALFLSALFLFVIFVVFLFWGLAKLLGEVFYEGMKLLK